MRRGARSLLLRARVQLDYQPRVSRLATTVASPVPRSGTLPNASFALRDYQEECIQSILSYFDRGGRRAGISLATGSGKTVPPPISRMFLLPTFVLIDQQVIFTQLIHRVKAPSQDAIQTLILAHRRELVEQAAFHCENAYPSKTVEIEMGNTKASGTADITVASVSSIVSGDRIKKFDPTKFKLVLVDEAHHIAAASYMQTLQYFGLLKDPDAMETSNDATTATIMPSTSGNFPALVGVSATLSRFDGVRLSDAIDHIIYHKDYVDMIGDKWLSDVVFTTVQSKADISRVKHTRHTDFQIGDLSRAVNNKMSNETTVRAWISKAAGRKSTLVFCVDLNHVTDLTATFRSHNIDAKYITSDTPKRVRSERLEAFKNGEFPVLLNCGVFTEGTDIPNIDCVLLARPTKSQNLLVQMIGRGMRLCPGKDNCHIIDMVASLDAGVITTPTLFGLDPAALIHEASVQELSEERERKEKEAKCEEELALQAIKATSAPNVPQSITFTDYDSVHDLIGDISGERHIRSISKLAWVRVRQDRYILSSQNGDYITVEASKSDQGYTVIYMKKIVDTDLTTGSKARSPYMQPREIAQTKTLVDAVHAADTFASNKFPWHYIHHGQAWRRAPASEAQLAFINKIRPMRDQLTADEVSKGQATDMISKTKFGAKGWFSEMEGEKKRKLKQADTLREREQVRVGPVDAH